MNNRVWKSGMEDRSEKKKATAPARENGGAVDPVAAREIQVVEEAIVWTPFNFKPQDMRGEESGCEVGDLR